jgi:hypothetical protein
VRTDDPLPARGDRSACGWISDFDSVHYDSTFTATVSADGMSYTGVAIY